MPSQEFFNILDYIYIGIMFISACFGFIKGFSRGVLGTCSWLLSGFFSVLVAPLLYRPVGKYITNDFCLRCACLALAFIGLMIIFLIITNAISSRVKSSVFSGMDRAFGLLFGLARGMLLIVTACGVMILFHIPQDQFTIVRDSQLSSFVFDNASEIIRICESSKLLPRKHVDPLRRNTRYKSNIHMRSMMPQIRAKKQPVNELPDDRNAD